MRRSERVLRLFPKLLRHCYIFIHFNSIYLSIIKCYPINKHITNLFFCLRIFILFYFFFFIIIILLLLLIISHQTLLRHPHSPLSTTIHSFIKSFFSICYFPFLILKNKNKKRSSKIYTSIYFCSHFMDIVIMTI